MTLVEHLGELRSRLFKVAVAFVVAAIVAWFFRVQIFDFLLAPSGDILNEKLVATGVTEQFINDLKLALYVAFVLTIPITLYQAWAFVVPAVGDLGRAFTYTLITMASLLFLAGVAFSYYFILPVGLNFLIGWAPERYETMITSNSYMSFVTRLLLASGIVFEFPAATYVGAKLELVDAPMLKKYRRHAIVANTILAAALTPTPDPFSMILLAVPMILMYELSIIIAGYVNPVSSAPAVRETDDEHEENGYEDEGADGDATEGTESSEDRDREL
jgi:sec-independent protein translocase protein TatC